MTFRTGRHVGRTIYAMLDDEPGDGDQLVGMMDTPDLADRVVRGLNALPLESRPMPHAERCDQPGGHDPHDYDVDAPAGQWRHCDGAAPPDEPVSVPPPVDPMKEWTRELLSRARADKTAPVPPPVDALLNRVDEIAFHADRIARADMSGARDKVDLHDAHYRRERAALRTDLGALWAAGVEEGRRLQREEFAAASLEARGLKAPEPRVNVDGIVPRVCIHCGGEIFMHGWWRHLATVRRDCPSGETRAEPPLVVPRG